MSVTNVYDDNDRVEVYSNSSDDERYTTRRVKNKGGINKNNNDYLLDSDLCIESEGTNSSNTGVEDNEELNSEDEKSSEVHINSESEDVINHESPEEDRNDTVVEDEEPPVNIGPTTRSGRSIKKINYKELSNVRAE